MPGARPERINSDKPHLWKADIAASVDQFNRWFMQFAPQAFRTTRVKTTEHVRDALVATDDLRDLTPARLKESPGALPTLRMCTAPPLAVDRLIGLSGANKSLVGRMEDGKLAVRMNQEVLLENLTSVCRVLNKLLDRDIFPWLDAGQSPTKHERDRASTIVADRLCTAVVDEEMRTSRRRILISIVARHLESRGLRESLHHADHPCNSSIAGTFQSGVAVPVVMGKYDRLDFDLLIQPRIARLDSPTLLLDFRSSPIPRRGKERFDRCAQKARDLKLNFGSCANYALVLDGAFSAGFLGTQAAEGAGQTHLIFEKVA